MSTEGAIQSALAPHSEVLDEDTLEYIQSLLADDPQDADAREAVEALIQGAFDDHEGTDPTDVCRALFDLLDLGQGGDGENGRTVDAAQEPALRKLEKTVVLKDQDVQSFAMGLQANQGTLGDDAEKESEIANFYANMIDITNAEAMSERDRRKARQKELRLKLEDEERQRAIAEAMEMFNNKGEGDDKDGKKQSVAGMVESSTDQLQDVQLRGFDLPNLRGGGPDLLSSANLILARGRRYGLMGRNGCGKTTLMTFLAGRRIPNAVPKNMNMLLVRQEIIGNDWSAVETVIKSDVKRESVKRFIQWCEEESDKLDNPEKYAASNGEDTTAEEEEAKQDKASSKGRQKLKDRKAQRLQKVARQKAEASVPKSVKGAASLEKRKAEIAEKLGKAYEHLAHIEEMEGGDPEPRARKVLSGLGFTAEMQDKPTSALSGGWRMRVSLSCALFANPSLLLLDEPTNHLDLEAVLWLEKYLTTQFKGTLVVVSHDRHFLNEVVTDVVHFHRSALTVYKGDITNFEAVREENRIRQIRLREQQEAKKAHLQKYIDLHSEAGENGPKASRQRKSKMKKLDKIGVMAQDGKRWKASDGLDAEEVEEYEEDEEVVLNFPDPGSFQEDIIKLELVKFGYEGSTQPLLEDVDLTIGFKSRIALLGRNGCGKSTLIKLTVGALRAQSGKVSIDGRAKIEYLAQHQLEQLDPDSTPLLTMTDRYPNDRSNTHIGELRRYLANFGLGGEVLPNQRIYTMSGGQKCRLCLALSMYRKPHLLILDEPTNHLDLETTEALIDAIKTFQGGVMLVSHDQHLLTSVCKDLYVVENGRLELLRGGDNNTDTFNAYKKAVLKGKR
jgi:ATP-binding cassette subfamily F protein 3